MTRLLKLKPWHLFVVLCIPIFIPNDTLFGQLIQFLFMCVYIGWIYSIGAYMNALIPARVRPSVSYFKFSCLFIVVTYAVIIVTGGFTINQDNYQDHGYSVFILVPLIFYMMWSFLYIFSFAARMLESVIEGEVVNRSDSLKALFCLLFFPWGIWHVQPAVQRILKAQDDKRITESK